MSSNPIPTEYAWRASSNLAEAVATKCCCGGCAGGAGDESRGVEDVPGAAAAAASSAWRAAGGGGSRRGGEGGIGEGTREAGGGDSVAVAVGSEAIASADGVEDGAAGAESTVAAAGRESGDDEAVDEGDGGDTVDTGFDTVGEEGSAGVDIVVYLGEAEEDETAVESGPRPLAAAEFWAQIGEAAAAVVELAGAGAAGEVTASGDEGAAGAGGGDGAGAASGHAAGAGEVVPCAKRALEADEALDAVEEDEAVVVVDVVEVEEAVDEHGERGGASALEGQQSRRRRGDLRGKYRVTRGWAFLSPPNLLGTVWISLLAQLTSSVLPGVPSLHHAPCPSLACPFSLRPAPRPLRARRGGRRRRPGGRVR